ncbi:helix-turn-helix domain-containing protein [Aeoliella sp. SH292]|uniref:helix-turn-helix domain-containing protein n=1 Tax=Aeoliella sp. SH292 TaxID=3454464 RepID=UPI003F9B071D
MPTDRIHIFTIDELATYLKVSKSTLYKLAQEGKVPGQKVGKHWRFRREAIDHWLDQQSDKPFKPR